MAPSPAPSGGSGVSASGGNGQGAQPGSRRARLRAGCPPAATALPTALPVSARCAQPPPCCAPGAGEVGRPGGLGGAPGGTEGGWRQLWGAQPWGRTGRRGINGAARFKFQISPRQMSLGKEQFMFVRREEGGGRGSPSLWAAAMARSVRSDCPGVGPPAPVCKAHSPSSPGTRQGRAFPATGQGAQMAEEVTEHVSGRAGLKPRPDRGSCLPCWVRSTPRPPPDSLLLKTDSLSP